MFRVFLLLLLLLPLSASARVNIYLFPEVETDKNNLTLSDIAGIEGDQAEQISAISIPKVLYKDFIVDRKELNDFLAVSLNQAFAIFGNGARLTFKKNETTVSEVIKEEKPVIVKKGEYVDLVIKNKGISIEMTGKSLQNGTVDDEINIRLRNGRILKGKPFSTGRVVVNL